MQYERTVRVYVKNQNQARPPSAPFLGGSQASKQKGVFDHIAVEDVSRIAIKYF